MAQNTPRGTPARVLVLLTLLTGVIMVSAWRDALRRQQDNWVRYPTALGDTGILQPGALPATMRLAGGAVLLEKSGPETTRRDDLMFRVPAAKGSADLPFTLFTDSGENDPDGEPMLFARTAPHRFQQLKATMGSPESSIQPPPAAPLMPPPPAPDGTAEAGGNPEAPKAVPLPDSEQDFPRILPDGGTL